LKIYILICTSVVLFFLTMFLIFYSLTNNAKTNQDEDDLAQLLQNHGINYVEKDDYANAKYYLLRALEKNKISEEKSLSWRGLTYLYLARNARYHNKWKEAENYYEKAASSLEKSLASIKNKAKLSQTEKDTFMTLCIVYKWLQRCFCLNQTQSKALTIYEKVKLLKINYSSSTLVLDIYPGLISNFMDLKKYKDSIKLADGAIDLYSSMKLSPKEQDQVATLWWLKANIFHLTGKPEKAVQTGQKAYAEFAKNHTKNSRYLRKISSCLKEWESLKAK